MATQNRVIFCLACRRSRYRDSQCLLLPSSYESQWTTLLVCYLATLPESNAPQRDAGSVEGYTSLETQLATRTAIPCLIEQEITRICYDPCKYNPKSGRPAKGRSFLVCSRTIATSRLRCSARSTRDFFAVRRLLRIVHGFSD